MMQEVISRESFGRDFGRRERPDGIGYLGLLRLWEISWSLVEEGPHQRLRWNSFVTYLERYRDGRFRRFADRTREWLQRSI